MSDLPPMLQHIQMMLAQAQGQQKPEEMNAFTPSPADAERTLYHNGMTDSPVRDERFRRHPGEARMQLRLLRGGYNPRIGKHAVDEHD